MATVAQKIHDSIYRIGRLARYCERLGEMNPTGLMSSLELNRSIASLPAVVRYKGLFYLVSADGRVLIGDPRISEVHSWFELHGDLLTPESALQDLTAFEETLTSIALDRARYEAIEELARRTIRRVTRPTTRGFKYDMKRRKKKPREG